MNKNYTLMELEAIKHLCKCVNSVASLPTDLIADTNVATNTTYSSYRIDAEMSALENDIQAYVDTALAGLNKLTKEVIDDKALVVKENVLYLYKDPSDMSNDYMQMMLINGQVVELGSTTCDFSSVYNKDEVDAKFALKIDLDVLTTSFNNLVTSVENKIDKDKIVTVLDDSVTDEQVPSAKVVYDGLESINDFSVQSALNAGNTTIPENVDLNDYLNPGVYTCAGGVIAKTLANCPHITSNFKLIVNKNVGNNNQFNGYQMIVGTVGSNPVRDVCIYYRGITTNNGVYLFSKWKIMSGSTVADVAKTQITSTNTTDVRDSGNAYYTVLNGICHVSLWGVIITNSGSNVKTGVVLPKPLFNGAGVFLTGSGTGTPSGFAYVEPHDCILTFDNAVTNQHLFGMFSYPVAE